MLTAVGYLMEILLSLILLRLEVGRPCVIHLSLLWKFLLNFIWREGNRRLSFQCWAPPFLFSAERHPFFSLLSATLSFQCWAPPFLFIAERHPFFSVLSATLSFQCWASPFLSMLSAECHPSQFRWVCYLESRSYTLLKYRRIESAEGHPFPA